MGARKDFADLKAAGQIPERDNGARLALGLADGDLEDLEHYLFDRVDEGASENTHYQAVRRVRALLIRMRDGKSVPTTYPTYVMNGEDL